MSSCELTRWSHMIYDVMVSSRHESRWDHMRNELMVRSYELMVRSWWDYMRNELIWEAVVYHCVNNCSKRKLKLLTRFNCIPCEENLNVQVHPPYDSNMWPTTPCPDRFLRLLMICGVFIADKTSAEHLVDNVRRVGLPNAIGRPAGFKHGWPCEVPGSNPQSRINIKF